MRVSSNVADQHYANYGASIDWRTPDNVSTPAEILPAWRKAGRDRHSPTAFPGLRGRPIDEFNVDLIYGHNIYGETANWVTLGTTFRFNVGK